MDFLKRFDFLKTVEVKVTKYSIYIQNHNKG